MRFFIIVLCLFSILYLSAIIINIPDDYPTIQEGIDVSVNADTVLVQPGTYIENINYNSKNITVASLFLTTQDTIYISQTIIDGNQNGTVVTFENGEDSTAVLTGITLTNGFGIRGGGITCEESSPTLNYIILLDNTSCAYGGGGIYCNESTSSLKNIIFSDNGTMQYCGGGGAILVRNNSVLTLENIAILENHAGNSGGGINCRDSNLIMVDVVISNNYPYYEGNGGGVYCYNSNLVLENVTISENYIHNDYIGSGGGIFCDHSFLTLKSVIIKGNYANYFGGGICGVSSSITNLENVTISENFAYYYGGGIYYRDGDLILQNVITNDNLARRGGGICCEITDLSLENVTITENNATFNGDGIYSLNSVLDLSNCIIWSNYPQEIVFAQDYNLTNTITVSYSSIQGGIDGIIIYSNTGNPLVWLEGNINSDPLFDNSFYHLNSTSPCVDAGNPDTIFNDPEDPNNPGYALYPSMGTIINDMGAYGGPNSIGWPTVGIYDNIIIQNPIVILGQNYPNPFNPSTTIEFSIQNESKVTLNVYNIKGQKVKTLINDNFEKGDHSIVWNGNDDFGKSVASGVYLYKLNVNGKTEAVKKCLLLK